MTEPDLNFIARQLDRVLSDLQGMRDDNARLRDDMAVLTAMVVRLEHSQGRMFDQFDRLHPRVRKLEDAQ
jgi:uncharacterized membrane protein